MTNDLIPAPQRRPVPAKIKAAIEALISGKAKNVTRAAAAVGISREHLSRELGKPHVSAFYRDQVARAVAMASGRAAARLEALLDAGSEHVSLDASKHVLGIAGIKPARDAKVNVNIDVKAGYIIDLSEHADSYRDPPKIVSPPSDRS